MKKMYPPWDRVVFRSGTLVDHSTDSDQLARPFDPLTMDPNTVAGPGDTSTNSSENCVR